MVMEASNFTEEIGPILRRVYSGNFSERETNLGYERIWRVRVKVIKEGEKKVIGIA